MKTALKRKRVLFLLLSSLLWAWGITEQSFAVVLEEIDISRRVDWATAGYPGEIPRINENIINVTAQGASSDDVADDHTAIQAAIDAAEDPGVVYLPTGTYYLRSPLKLKSGVLLRGDGSNSTRLVCRSDDGCIEIIGTTDGGHRPIVSGLEKGSVQITVSDASEFQVGHGGEIRQEDIEAVDPTGEWGRNTDWVPTHVMGQMVKIVAIEGNRLTIHPPLHIHFNPEKNPEIMPVTYKERIGIEDLTLQRLDTGTISNNINIRRAADCWFQRIESDQTQKYHFSISESLHLEIRGCYIHDAYHKGGGGRGYGTSLGRYVTSVLVEDNIFSDLRHAMIIQLGTNGCVFGYNYAQRNYSDDGWDKTYISVHGHYPYMNLFEGNVVGFAGLADYWGASGPGNTLFRNRMVGTDKHRDFGPYRGIAVDDYSHRQNIIGNELIGSETHISFDGQDDMAQGTSQELIVHGNNVHGTITWDDGFHSAHDLPASLYRPAKPAFFDDLPWPAMGPDVALDTGTIPAMERFHRQAFVDQPAGEDGGNGSGNENDTDTSGGNDSPGGSGNGDSSSCFITLLK